MYGRAWVCLEEEQQSGFFGSRHRSMPLDGVKSYLESDAGLCDLHNVTPEYHIQGRSVDPGDEHFPATSVRAKHSQSNDILQYRDVHLCLLGGDGDADLGLVKV